MSKEQKRKQPKITKANFSLICARCGETLGGHLGYRCIDDKGEYEAEERARIEAQSISVLIECGGRKYRVIDSLRKLIGGETDRYTAEAIIGRKVLDLARTLEVSDGEKLRG